MILNVPVDDWNLRIQRVIIKDINYLRSIINDFVNLICKDFIIINKGIAYNGCKFIIFNSKVFIFFAFYQDGQGIGLGIVEWFVYLWLEMIEKLIIY